MSKTITYQLTYIKIINIMDTTEMLLKEIRMLKLQHLRLSECLAYANERISKLEGGNTNETETETHELETKYKHMKVLAHRK